MSRLTTDMKDEDSRPYFLWDEPLTIRQLRAILRSGDEGLHLMLEEHGVN